jgi:GT2 family glycosyltransferase
MSGSRVMDSAPPVAVVIPSWNCLGDLVGCVESVQAQDGVQVELVVVDNGSTDGTVAFLQREGIPHLALPQNLGFARAVNLGASRTRSPLVMVLNADTRLEPGCLERLAAALETDTTLGGVQPLILQLDPALPRRPDDQHTIVYSLGQALTADGRGREEAAGLPLRSVSAEPREIFGVCGAACMMRRDLLVALGGYEERYFAFCEDVDLNVRARVAGWPFALEPSAVVWHLGNVAWARSFERPRADNARLVARNRLATQIKFMPVRSTPMMALVEAGALVQAAREHRLLATLAGKLAVLRWLPWLIRERRRLRRRGDPSRARAWLGIEWAHKPVSN